MRIYAISDFFMLRTYTERHREGTEDHREGW